MKIISSAILVVGTLSLGLHAASARKESPRLRSIRDIKASAARPLQKDAVRTTSAAPLAPDQRIVLEDQSWFEPGTARMTSRGIQQVSELAVTIKKMGLDWTHTTLQVEGHTDSSPVVRHRADYPSNWELSGMRAFTVVRLLEGNGFPRERLSGVGYADSRPDGNHARRRLVISIQATVRVQEMAKR